MEWTTTTLGDCCEVVSGATPSTSRPEFWDGDIVWATPKDLSELDGPYIRDTPRKITEAGLNNCAATILPVNSVLFSSRAPIGHVAVNTVPMATNQGFKSFIPDRQRVDAKFLYHWLRHRRSFLQSLGNGATFKEVSKAVVSRVEIRLPPLPEQRRIAAILDRADELRAKRRAALEKLNGLTQAMFLEMFGDPVTNLKGWSNPTLGGTLRFQQYGPRFFNERYKTDGIRIVRITDLNENGTLDFSTMPRLDVSAEDIEKYQLKPGDLVFARSGATVGKVALIQPDGPPCIAGAYFITMRFQDLVEPVYVREVLTAKSVRAIVTRRSRQAAQQNFSGPGLRALPMPVPPLTLQRCFTRQVSAVENVKAVQQASMTKCDALFVSLQHRAFAGAL
jgi:type I restriction enzyme S subunit